MTSAAHASRNQADPDLVVFSNDFAKRRDLPSRPWATSTRHACAIGLNTGCLSSHRSSAPRR
ncbi:hypothetical protein [Pengzhenrongella sp.]|jgi:hypothetical protein|uniref:hypothetical protein n=1 Tax=Pengzhenrongella sp. TaxID=2888820 RepID=UPI002F95DD6F